MRKYGGYSFVIVSFILCCFILFRLSKQSEYRIGNRASVLLIQPLGEFERERVQELRKRISSYIPCTYILPSQNLPKWAFVSSKQRYRADSILRRYSRVYSNDTTLLFVLNKDISTTKGTIQDWGVMGLGRCPGNVCVVSTHRLQRETISEQFFKVAIHELGHTRGLSHCENKECFMRDAEGKNPTNEEKKFCSVCQSKLKNFGWHIE